MIELLINKRTRLPIVAKPPGSPWTAREIDGPNLCVVTLDDPPAELVEKVRVKGPPGAFGVLAHPFLKVLKRDRILLCEAALRCEARVGPSMEYLPSAIKFPAGKVKAKAKLKLADASAVADDQVRQAGRRRDQRKA